MIGAHDGRVEVQPVFALRHALRTAQAALPGDLQIERKYEERLTLTIAEVGLLASVATSESERQLIDRVAEALACSGWELLEADQFRSRQLVVHGSPQLICQVEPGEVTMLPGQGLAGPSVVEDIKRLITAGRATVYVRIWYADPTALK